MVSGDGKGSYRMVVMFFVVGLSWVGSRHTRECIVGFLIRLAGRSVFVIVSRHSGLT